MYIEERLCKTHLFTFKNKANARVGTEARFYASESRTVAQKVSMQKEGT